MLMNIKIAEKTKIEVRMIALSEMLDKSKNKKRLLTDEELQELKAMEEKLSF